MYFSMAEKRVSIVSAKLSELLEPTRNERDTPLPCPKPPLPYHCIKTSIPALVHSRRCYEGRIAETPSTGNMLDGTICDPSEGIARCPDPCRYG